MTSANDVLMKFFKLPPAVKMMLALAGFGSLASILFMVMPGLRTRQGKMWVLIIGGIALVLFLIVFLIRRYFFGKKSSQLSDALESQGPTRGDIAEQEQIYREKFRAKLSELKTNGLSVYKLPWFVLMGEPGCGKTASLIHSGLDFPLGKDEVPGFGGTRNYNWWFTNEAVLLDTAGRIAFQEEGTTDKTEWEYFLKLLKSYRPRCPVNGVVIALPADKLLRDNAEERAQKATVLRERLRQVHQLLGVRFPTFVLMTKMDLVGGFSEFFEEVRVDLQQRNQMFGWSRPGEFHEPYEPDTFGEAFDEVHTRIRDWAMRYLNRKATDDELGMVVTFPESFSQLRQPIDDYIATIFQKSPLLEPPFFRGFYFTSAVQEGAPILDLLSRSQEQTHLVERAPKAVDSKAFFIHDFYARKVFPEHGLVFRSAKHVSLNRRMRRMVWIGSAAMVLLMVTLFAFGRGSVKRLVDEPRNDCKVATDVIKEGGVPFGELEGNLRIAQRLHSHYEAYSAPWTGFQARLLFIGANIHQPEAHVRTIHARFVLEALLKPVLLEAGTRLSTEDLSKLANDVEGRKRFVEGLAALTRWYGEVVGQHAQSELDESEAVQRRGQFEKLLAYLEVPEQDAREAGEQFELALTNLSSETRSFARNILRDTLKFDADSATRELVAAIDLIAADWKPVTELSAENTNPLVSYWVEFANRIADVRAQYDELLNQSESLRRSGDPDAIQKGIDGFLRISKGSEYLGDLNYTGEPGTFKEKFDNLKRFLEDEDNPVPQNNLRIIRLSGLLSEFQNEWNAEFDPVEAALAVGAPDSSTDPQKAVYEALKRGRQSLNESFENSLADIRKRLGIEADAEPLDVYVKQNLLRIEEAQKGQRFSGDRAKIELVRNPFGQNDKVKQCILEMRQLIPGAEQQTAQLEQLSNWPALLEGSSAVVPPGAALGAWFQSVQSASAARIAELIVQQSGFADRPFWKPDELFRTAKLLWTVRKESSIGMLLDAMEKRAAAAASESTLAGLARLMPGFDAPLPKVLPFDRNEFNSAAPTPREEPAAGAQPEEQDQDRTRRRRRRRTQPEDQPKDQGDSGRGRSERGKGMLLVRYHTRDFLVQTLYAYWDTREALHAHSGDAAKRAAAALDASANAYIDEYFRDWNGVYTDYRKLLDASTLRLLSECRDGALDWPTFQERIATQGRGIGDELVSRFEALMRELILFADALGDQPRDDKLEDLLNDRLAFLRRSGEDLPDKLDDLWRSADRVRQGDPERVLSNKLMDIWSEYVRKLNRLGPQADKAKEAPNLAALREQYQSSLVWRRSKPEEFGFIRPLLAIADYGQALLIHHLDAQLIGLFTPSAGKFPVVRKSAALDETAKLNQLSTMPTIKPAEFIELLTHAAEFQQRYGELYANVQSESAAQRALKAAEAWANFMLNTDRGFAALRRKDKPARLPVRIGFVAADPSAGVNPPRSVYKDVRVTLPVLNESGGPAATIEFAADTINNVSVQDAVGGENGLRFRWDLFAPSFAPTTVSVSQRHGDARATFRDPATSFELAGESWSLMKLLGARSENDLSDGFWRIPVYIDTGDDPIGFTIAVRLGTRDVPLPGPIPPPGEAPPRPKMMQAEVFFAGPPR